MKLTNEHDLPQPIYEAVKNDDYNRGGANISVTSLIGPPRIEALREKYGEEVVEDASDRIWSLLGQTMHAILEKSTLEGIAERRLSTMCEGWVVSGGMDYYTKDGKVTDYKLTSFWKFKNGQHPPEYEQQLNLYAELLRQSGHEVKELEIFVILRDWSKGMTARDSSLPQKQFLKLPIPLWPQAQAQAFMKQRVRVHQAARKELPECEPMDMWEKPTIYAVMKEGRKTSMKNFTDQSEAQEFANEKGAYVQVRPGERTRCMSYCSVAPFCNQYQEYLNQNQPNKEAV